MRFTKVNLLLAVFLFFQLCFVSAQVQKGDLIKGQYIRSEIETNEKHKYSLELKQDQFAFLQLMQEGVDMKITTYDPSGEKIADFDSPNGKNGPEYFSINAAKKGKYSIEVAPFNEDEPKGSYKLVLKIIKQKAISNSDRVDELFIAWDNKDTPGATVAVVKDGSIIYKKGYGLANLEYDIPNQASTIFHIASVSKQFTVFSIMLLEKEGKLSLEDDIRKYIPEVPDFGKTITLRHLASHTSGLRDQWNLLAMAGWRLDDVITTEHVLKLVSKQKELNFNPGEEFLYCNTGFTLLAEVVARVSEQSFAEFTHSHIFRPLKMTNTLFYDDHEKIVKNRAYSYYSTPDGYKKSVLNYANVGATSLFTTVEDLSLWAMNFSKLIVGDTTIVNEMNELAVLNNGKTFGGALGQFVGEYKGLKQIQHGGADAGYRSYLTRFPDEAFSVCVFSNSAQFNPGGIANQIVDIYLKERIAVETMEQMPTEEKTDEQFSLEQDILRTYVGEFEIQPGFNISIAESNGNLTGQATGQPSFPLNAISDTEFNVQGVEAKIEFVPNDGNKVQLFKLYQGGQIIEAKRLKEFDKEAVVLSEFTGSFYSDEITTTYNFIIEEDKLIARHKRLSDIIINPVKEDVFRGNTWFFGQIEFVRNSNDEITGCKVSSGRVRNLFFNKLNR